MLFNSQIFIFLFLPAVLMLWFGLHRAGLHRTAQAALLGMSLWFYAYFNLRYLEILLASICVNYLISLLLEYLRGSVGKERAGSAQLLLFAGLVFNIGILFYFKYFDFFLENLNQLSGSSFGMRHLLLPLGISFFTFQQLSYIVDRYKGTAPHYPFLEYAVFVAFFPQLIAGPIVLHSELVPQLSDRKRWAFDRENFTHGICLFILGLSKKVLLADTIAYVVNYGFDRVYYLDTLSAIVTAVAYSFELYFDFSGYCDMAIGIGSMFNLGLPENFDSPYKSSSVKEFWRRWHMTLGRFFTQYVYFPLGGSRRGFLRTNVNVLIVFALSGLWHGANWTFVIWGISQGAAIVAGNIFDSVTGRPNILSGAVSRGLTYSYTVLTLSMFRSLNVETGLEFLKRIFVPSNTGFIFELAGALDIPELYIPSQALKLLSPGLLQALYPAVFAVIMTIGAFFIAGRKAAEVIEVKAGSSSFAICLAFLFMWSVISLSGASTFLYFNF